MVMVKAWDRAGSMVNGDVNRLINSIANTISCTSFVLVLPPVLLRCLSVWDSFDPVAFSAGLEIFADISLLFYEAVRFRRRGKNPGTLFL